MEIAYREKRKKWWSDHASSYFCHDRDSSSGESCAAHYFKISIELRNDFRGEIFTFYKVGYPEESDMRSSAVLKKYIYKSHQTVSKNKSGSWYVEHGREDGEERGEEWGRGLWEGGVERLESSPRQRHQPDTDDDWQTFRQSVVKLFLGESYKSEEYDCNLKYFSRILWVNHNKIKMS